ncbi:MAG: hypothetical protein ACXW28_10310 [Thermoanaerobaculia bacterium]
MEKILAAAVCCVFLACASNDAKIIPPEIQFVQLSGPADQNYTPGDIEVQYGLRIANRSSEPITLRNVQLRSVGAGGAYRVLPRTYAFERTIKPEQYEDVTFWAKAVAAGDAFAPDATAPITVRVTAYFETPEGGFRKVFTTMLEQRGTLGGPR